MYFKYLHLIIILIAVALPGCRSTEVHPWRCPGNDMSVAIDTRKWPIVSQNLYIHVPTKKIKEAEKLLTDKEFQPLNKQQAEYFGNGFPVPEDKTLQPYLVRGVGFAPYYYTIIRKNPDTNELVTYHATWNGEIFLPGLINFRLNSCPILIYLDKAPLRVYPTAELGGDWLMCRNRKEIDTRQPDKSDILKCDKGKTANAD